jgi:outer membrane protein assembly factor BamB
LAVLVHVLEVVAWPRVVDRRIAVEREPLRHRVSPEAEGAIVADPAVTAEYYLAGCEGGYFYAIGTSSGRLIWRRPTGPVRHGAVVSKTKVYVVNVSGVFHAFDLKRGKELWKYEAGEGPVAAPCLGKGVLYLPLPDRVEKIATKTGSLADRLPAKGIAGAPVLDKQFLYYGTKDGEVVTLELKSGKEKARVKVAEASVSTPLVCARKILYGTAGSTIFAYEPKSRKILWTYEGEDPFQPLIVADKSIYVGAGNVFYGLR